MRLLGLDLGSQTVGVAISDGLGILASPLTTLNFPPEDYEAALKQVIDLTNTEEIGAIVIGLPKHLNGTIGERGNISLAFQAELEKVLTIPIIAWDERFTTKQAQRILIMADVSRQKRKKVIDKMAAVLILQSYLDTNRK